MKREPKWLGYSLLIFIQNENTNLYHKDLLHRNVQFLFLSQRIQDADKEWKFPEFLGIIYSGPEGARKCVRVFCLRHQLNNKKELSEIKEGLEIKEP